MGTDTLVLGRFLLGEPAPAPAGLKRWRAVDQATGQPVDVVAPDAATLIRPGAAEQFQLAARFQDEHPALLLPSASGTEERRPFLVRAPSEPLGALPRLDADRAVALAAWLAPAASRAEGALGGVLSPDDLVRDAEGTVRLAPRGLAAPARALKAPAHQSPEQQGGAPPLPGSALYGLGVMLFEATTGQPHQAGRRAREIDPSLPDSLDELLAALCSADPQQRRRAADSLPQGAPVRLPSAQPAPTAPLTPTPVGPEPALALSEGWHLVLEAPPATAAARARLGALLDLPPEILSPMLERGESISLGLMASPAQAQARAAQLRELGIEAKAVAPASPWAAALLLISALGALGSFALALAGLLLGLIGSLLVLGGAALSLLLGAMLSVLSLRLYREGALRSAVEGASTRQARLRRESAPAEDALSRALRQAHRSVLDSDLHPVVRLDHERLLEELATQRGLRPDDELSREAERIALQAFSLRHEPALTPQPASPQRSARRPPQQERQP